jgi:sulfonate transport system substrate-binding protein
MRQKHRKARNPLLLILILALVTAIAGCGKEAAGPSSAGGTTSASSPDRKQAGDQSKGAGKDIADKEKAKVVRIGFQKYGTMNFLKTQGGLEKALSAKGYNVQWTEFPGGPQLLEAMNVGSIDIGHTGEAPPIFAQAAGTPLVYLGHEKASPESEAILVPKDSPIKSVAELKGKKVVLNKGSNVHYLLVKQLEAAGLKYEDIQTVFLPPADARAAFERGSVDAWVIWDPFFAAAQTATKAKVLADGKGVVKNHEFYLAQKTFAQNNQEVVQTLLDELKKVDEWAKGNLHQLAETLSPQLGIDVESLEVASKRRDYGVEPMDDDVIAEQQRIADTFQKVGLIPKAINVKDAVLK